MGQNKAAVELGGTTLLRHVARRLVDQSSLIAVNAPTHPDPGTGFQPITDTMHGFLGPLAGILAAMRFAANLPNAASHVLTAAIDTPFLPTDLANRLAAAINGNDAVAVASSFNAMHPVCGLWPLSLADDLEAFLNSPEKARVKTFLSHHQTSVVEFEPLQTKIGPIDPFFNVNTPDDLAMAESYLEALS